MKKRFSWDAYILEVKGAYRDGLECGPGYIIPGLINQPTITFLLNTSGRTVEDVNKELMSLLPVGLIRVTIEKIEEVE